jgi:O-antigen/teichoic acid export membrane protein
VSFIGILFAIDVVASIGPTASAAFYGLLDFKEYAVIYTIYSSFRPWLVVLLVFEVKSLVGLMAAWVVSDAVLALYMFWYLWQRLGPPVLRFDTKYLLKLSSPLYLASIASFFYGTFDQLTLIPLVSLTALGIYGAVVNAFSAYTGLISVIGSVLLPSLSGVHGARGPDALKSSVSRASRYVAILGMPVAFALVAIARPALTLLVGRQYEGGSLPLAVLALASTTTIIATALGPVLIVMNETLLAASTTLLPLPLSVALALIAIPRLGILGASIARGLSMVFSLVLTWYFLRRKILVRLDYGAIVKSVLASAVMALVMGTIQLLYYIRILLPVYLLIGLIVYLLGLRALKLITIADIELVRQILGQRFSWLSDLLYRLVV